MVIGLLVVDGVKYKLWTPRDEEKEFHPMIKEHSKEIFGEDSIYFDVKHRLISRSGIGSIPDAYVISLSKPYQWYIVENELASHRVYEHIVPQISKFISGIENLRSQREIRDALYDEITQDKVLKASVEIMIHPEEIHRFLSSLVSKSPRIAIIIDEVTDEVREASKALKKLGETEILGFKTYVREDAERVHAHLFEPIYALYKPVIKKASEIPITIPKEFPVVSREELASLKEGQVVICPSKPESVNFLLQYNAWGFVRIRREPGYFALYISHPESRVSFFGEVREILYPKDPGSPITEEARQYKEFKEGKKVIVLKPGSLRKLDKGIIKGTLKKIPQGLKYVTLSQFISAKTLDDL